MNVYAVMKVSYHWEQKAPNSNVYKPNANGGFLGTSFFANENTAISAYHVINETTLIPESPHSDAQLWLISTNGFSHEINQTMMEFHPKLDLTIIRFPIKQSNAQTFKLSQVFDLNTEVFNEGFPSYGPPKVNLEVNQCGSKPNLKIENSDLTNSVMRSSGGIKSINKETIITNDIRLNNVEIIRTNYGGKKGMSGSPLIKNYDRSVIGLMSFGFPPDSEDKTELCAISINEFINLI